MTDSGEASAFPNWDENRWHFTDGISWSGATSKEKWQQRRQVLLLSRLQKLKEKEKNDHKNLLSNQAYLLICGS